MNTEHELIMLATVLGVCIARSEYDSADRFLSRLLLKAAETVVDSGRTSEAIDALATGIRIGLEPSGPNGGIGAEIVRLVPKVA